MYIIAGTEVKQSKPINVQTYIAAKRKRKAGTDMNGFDGWRMESNQIGHSFLSQQTLVIIELTYYLLFLVGQLQFVWGRGGRERGGYGIFWVSDFFNQWMYMYEFFNTGMRRTLWVLFPPVVALRALCDLLILILIDSIWRTPPKKRNSYYPIGIFTSTAVFRRWKNINNLLYYFFRFIRFASPKKKRTSTFILPKSIQAWADTLKKTIIV